MYSIYFNNRIIRVCNASETNSYNPNAVVLNCADDKTLEELPGLFDTNENLKMLYIPVPACEMESTYRKLLAGEATRMDVLERICVALKVDIGDVCSFRTSR